MNSIGSYDLRLSLNVVLFLCDICSCHSGFDKDINILDQKGVMFTWATRYTCIIEFSHFHELT
jgi:hypothetical protein